MAGVILISSTMWLECLLTDERDLGVKVTQSSKSSKYRNMTTAEANMVLGVIKKTITSRDSTATPKLNKFFVRSRLKYAIRLCQLGTVHRKPRSKPIE